MLGNVPNTTGRPSWFVAVVASILLAFVSHQRALAEPKISWEIVRETGAPIDGAQRWMRFLERSSPASLRVRSKRVGDQPRVEDMTSERGTTLRVTAVLTRRNQLRVPGRTIRLGDAAALKTWIETLGTPSTNNSLPSGDQPNKETPFGISSARLNQLRNRLATAVTSSTKEQSLPTVFRDLRRQAELAVSVSGRARERLRSEAAVKDEYQGIALGTALAALLRTEDLLFVPQPTRHASIMLRVVTNRADAHGWPVGWPIEQPDHRVLPKLLDRLPVEIADVPVQRVIDALAPRLECPLLWDHAAAARRDVDLGKALVTFRSKRTFYKRVLEHALFQAKMEMEVRHDDGQRPFIWISPIQLR